MICNLRLGASKEQRAEVGVSGWSEIPSYIEDRGGLGLALGLLDSGPWGAMGGQ